MDGELLGDDDDTVSRAPSTRGGMLTQLMLMTYMSLGWPVPSVAGAAGYYEALMEL